MKKVAIAMSLLALALVMLVSGCTQDDQTVNNNKVVYGLEDGFKVNLPDNLYKCQQSASAHEKVYGFRFDEDCSVNDVFEMTLRIVSNKQGLSLVEIFDSSFHNRYAAEFPLGNTNSSSISTIRDYADKEFIKINGQEALRVYLPKSDTLAIVVIAPDGARAAVFSLGNARGQFKMEEKYGSVINSFAFDSSAGI